MKVLKENLSGIVVLTLKGEFDSFVTNAFTNEIQKVLDEGTTGVVLNMRLVKFVNSTALGSMIKARKAAKAKHGDLVVSQPSPAVREAMESLGLDRLFSVYDDDESAMAALGQDDSVDMDDGEETAIMLYVPEDTKPIVGRLTRLDTDTIDCRINGPAGKLTKGREIRLKFRLPLYRKEFFDLSGRIELLDASASSTVLSLHITKASDEDLDDIVKFVEDMSELRREARDS